MAVSDSLGSWFNQTPDVSYRAISGLNWPGGKSIIPDFALEAGPIRLAVEYDGWWFHKSPKRRRVDWAKTKFLREAGFVVIRVRESPLPVMDLKRDLIVDPAMIYSGDVEGFQYLTEAVRNHVDMVCKCEFGIIWPNFLTERAEATMLSTVPRLV